MIYEQKDIDLLLKCEKEILEPPTKDYKEMRGHGKKNFTLCSIDKKYFFRAFIRYNIMFPENFSVGLDFNPREEKGTICLLRCNGTHGENIQIPHHQSFHIHQATSETINSGEKPESNIEIVDSYASLEQAIQYFIKFINLRKLDCTKYFPPKQLGLFE